MKKFELTIPKPCHENWNAMTPEDKGRFCGSCQKTVIDFSEMSDRQLAQFFKQPVGSVCGRFNGDQLERTIEVPKKRIPWVKYFFTIALPAFLLSKKATAQGEVKITGKVSTCVKPAIKGDTIADPVVIQPESRAMMLGEIESIPVIKTDTNVVLKGRITDESGKPVQYASIRVSGTQQYAMSDSAGYFTLRCKKSFGQIEISSVGFELKQVDYKSASFLSVTLQSYRYTDMLGMVVKVPEKKKKPIPLNPVMKNDTAFSKFAIFPNPAASNSSITVQTKELVKGYYILSILTSTGELVQSQEIAISKKAETLNYDLGNIAAGPYFIRLTSKENNKSFTEILLVK